jgi:hypothetical protein
MRDFDPEKRRGRWTLYLFAAALLLVAGQFVAAGYDAVTRPAAPNLAMHALQPRLDTLPVRPSATFSLRVDEAIRVDEMFAAGPAAAAAATPPAQDAAAWAADPAGVVERAAAEAPASLRANRPQINLRTGPGLQHGVLTRVNQDTILTPTGRKDGDWVEVTIGQQTDQRGWVSRGVTEERR